MTSPWAGRDPGFYGSPVIKSVLLLSGTASLCHALSIFKTSYPSAWLVMRIWSLPSFGTWLIAALILYQCRVIERRQGSFKTISNLFFSTLLSSTMFCSFLWSSGAIHTYTGWNVNLVPGVMIYFLIGSLVATHMTSVTSAHSSLAGLSLSRSIPLYILVAWCSSSSCSSGVATIAGLLSGLCVRVLNVSLPHPPLWLTSVLRHLVCHETPPTMFSGASLQVQSQQRTDELERLMMSMYNRQRQRPVLVIGQPVLQPPQEPAQHKIQQLVSMGFSREASSQALRQTGGNVEAALGILTARVS